MTGPYGTGAPAYAGTGLGYPMPIRGKDAFIPGVTGRPGRIVQAQVDGWVVAHPDDNLGLVLDWTVVGIDVDDGYLNHHGRSKHGAATVAALEAGSGGRPPLGKLPATVTSTSRADTHPESRVHLYRVSPEDGRRLNTNLDLPPARPGDQFSDVEVLHHQYRYLAAWPSLHPDTGQQYRWYDREEQPLDRPPSVDELEDLPEAWVGYLLARVKTGDLDDYGYASKAEINAALTDGAPGPELSNLAARFWQDDIHHGDGGDVYGPDLLGLTRALAEHVATRQPTGSRAAVDLAYAGYTRGRYDTEKNRRAFRAAFARSLKLWLEKARERAEAAAVERELHDMLHGQPPAPTPDVHQLAPPAEEAGPSADDDASEQAVDVDVQGPSGPDGPTPSRADGAAVGAAQLFEEQTLAEVGRLRVRAEAARRLEEEGADHADMPRMVRLDAFLAEPDEEQRWRVADVWPAGGNVVLVAPAKSGKSSMVGNLLRSLADGEPFLDEHEANPGRVVVLDDELSEGTWRRWLRDQGVANTTRVHLVSLRGQLESFNILNPAVRARWVELLRTVEPEVLVLDCVRPVLDALGLDESHDAGKLFVAFDHLKREAGIADGFLVHHAGHNPTRARGDSRFKDWPDATWNIFGTLDEDGNVDHSQPRDFYAGGRDVDQPRRQILYDPATRRMTLAARSTAAATKADLTSVVVEYVGDHPDVIQKELVAAVRGLGYGRDAVFNAIQDAVRQGRLFTQRGESNSVTYRLLGFRAS